MQISLHKKPIGTIWLFWFALTGTKLYDVAIAADDAKISGKTISFLKVLIFISFSLVDKFIY